MFNFFGNPWDDFFFGDYKYFLLSLCACKRSCFRSASAIDDRIVNYFSDETRYKILPTPRLEDIVLIEQERKILNVIEKHKSRARKTSISRFSLFRGKMVSYIKKRMSIFVILSQHEEKSSPDLCHVIHYHYQLVPSLQTVSRKLNQKHPLIVVSGPPGVGKTTLLNKLRDKCEGSAEQIES